MRNCKRLALLAPSSSGTPPTDAQLAEARAALLLTDEQLLRCYELQQLELLTKELLTTTGGSSDGGEEGADVEKPFRLAVRAGWFGLGSNPNPNPSGEGWVVRVRV